MEAGSGFTGNGSSFDTGTTTMWKRLLNPSNRRVRLLVGLMLVGLFLIHSTQGEANRAADSLATVIDGRQIGGSSADILDRLEDWARTDHIALLEFCLKNYDARYQDYTCTLRKQERIGGKLGKEQTVAVSFRQAPYSVGMKWVKNARMGDRVLFVEGQYGDNMLVRPSSGFLRSLCPTAVRKPDGPDAMKSTLRPVNLFGFRRGTQSLLKVYRQAKKRGELKIAFGGYADVAGRKTIVLVRYLPPTDAYRVTAAPLTKTYIDVDYLVPIMIEGTELEGRGRDDKGFLCRYVYEDLKFNRGLTDETFRPEAFGLVKPK